MSTADSDTKQIPFHPLASGPQRPLGQSLTAGFALALAVWTTWFITHLPWVSLPEPTRLGIVLSIWIIAAALLARRGPVIPSLGAGLVSAILGLLLLGSKLREKAGAGPLPGQIKPEAAVIALGFVALGAAVGLAGWGLSRSLPAKPRPNRDWLASFAIVAAATIGVLLFIGGLVTSTNSGMAVPDWPRTYGANMFLYPLTGAATDIFLEHSHRLFGILVGLATLTLLIWTVATEKRGWVRIIAVVILLLVISQGIIGGFRVTGNNRFLAMLHGVLGQVTFGAVIAMAVFLTPTFKLFPQGPIEELPNARRLRLLTTGFLHATILQLILGAAYRHFRDNHSLYSHIALSIFVLLLGQAAGFAAKAIRGNHGGIGPVLRRLGPWMNAIVGIQFLLGLGAFLAGGRTVAAASPGQAVIRTIHQANGALVLALAVLGFCWTRRLLRRPA